MSDSFHAVDYSSPGFSVHGILQPRILEWVAIPFSIHIYYIFFHSSTDEHILDIFNEMLDLLNNNAVNVEVYIIF